MKLSTAKRRINKTLNELTQSVVDDWYANFKNGYIKGYTDARQGKAPMYAEAHKVADTPQTDCPFKDVPCSCGEQDECEWHTELDAPQTDCGWK